MKAKRTTRATWRVTSVSSGRPVTDIIRNETPNTAIAHALALKADGTRGRIYIQHWGPEGQVLKFIVTRHGAFAWRAMKHRKDGTWLVPPGGLKKRLAKQPKFAICRTAEREERPLPGSKR